LFKSHLTFKLVMAEDDENKVDSSYCMNESGEQILKYPLVTIKIRLSVITSVILSVFLAFNIRGFMFSVARPDYGFREGQHDRERRGSRYWNDRDMREDCVAIFLEDAFIIHILCR